MPKIRYIDKAFRDETLNTIERAAGIIAEYSARGFDLTLRQLYYQFVARGHIENTERSYKRLGATINDARLAGLIDWDAIVDRTRTLRKVQTWKSPAEIIEAAAQGYRMDVWETSNFRPEVWIEKEALLGVIEGICRELCVPWYAARGYNSQSAQWRAGQRAIEHGRNDQISIIYYLGDHDPSGLDMPRDIEARFALFTSGVEVNRLALNMDQIALFDLPPNPAKLSDARAAGYVDAFGTESWELDALDPDVIVDLIRCAIQGIKDPDKQDKILQAEGRHRTALLDFAQRWEDSL